MYETKHAATVDLKADEQGHIEAVFSTFDVVDSDGDILVREAFTDGQKVPLVWAHDWSRPVGKGVIRTDAKRAIFAGDFFMDTTDGADAYRTVKAMSDLQEFSWGFRILDAEQEVRDGMPVRVITKAEVFEVSPVLVGANRETYTLAIKGRRRISRGQLEGAIAVLSALLGDDTDDADAEPDATASDQPADEGKTSPLGHAAGLKAYAAGLKATDDETIVSVRDQVAEMLAELGAIRGDLEAIAKRADLAANENPRELLRQFRRLESIYGAPIQSGRVAV